MIRFNNDYSEICHERILKRLSEINVTQNCGYSEDDYCKEAADIIRKVIVRCDERKKEKEALKLNS